MSFVRNLFYELKIVQNFKQEGKMVAYREIVNSQEDILHIVNMLKEIKDGAEVIIIPLEKKREMRI